MDYTNITLLGLGILGILMHNLLNLNKINKAAKGNINLLQYLKIEVYGILLSICVIFVCLIVKTEIQQLNAVGKWLGLSFVTVGYMAQSLVITFMGRAAKIIDSDIGGYKAPKDQEQQNQ